MHRDQRHTVLPRDPDSGNKLEQYGTAPGREGCEKNVGAEGLHNRRPSEHTQANVTLILPVLHCSVVTPTQLRHNAMFMISAAMKLIVYASDAVKNVHYLLVFK